MRRISSLLAIVAGLGVGLWLAPLALGVTAGCCVIATCPETVVVVERDGLDALDLHVTVELGESLVIEVDCAPNEGCDPPLDQGVLVARRSDSDGEGLLITLRQVDPVEAPVLNLTVASSVGDVWFGTSELDWRQGLDACSDTPCAQANTETITLEP